MGRGQGAVPAIMILLIGLVMFYLLWIQPGDRSDILGLNDSTGATQITNPESTSNIIFSQPIGYVGRGTGQALQTINLGSFQVSYPETATVILARDTAVLTANILSAGKIETTLSGEYASADVSFVVGDIKGSPKIRVISAGTDLFTEQASAGQSVNLSISAGRIIDDDLKVVCSWSGLVFWEQQSCELDNLTISKVVYTNVNPTVFKDFSVGSNINLAEDVKLSFRIGNGSVNKNDLIIRANDVSLYSARPSNMSTLYIVRSDVITSRISQGANNLMFEALSGSVYNIENAVLQIFEKVGAASNKTFYFTIPNDVYTSKNLFILNITVDNIIDSGGLDFVLNNVYYYLSPDQITTGSNLITVSKSNLLAGANKARIESSTGRFNIDKVELMWQ